MRAAILASLVAALPAAAADPVPAKPAVVVLGADRQPAPLPAADAGVPCPPGRFVPLVCERPGPFAFDPSDPAAVGQSVLLPPGAQLYGQRFDEDKPRLHVFDKPAFVLFPVADVSVAVWGNGADGKPPEKVQTVRIKAGQGPKPPPGPQPNPNPPPDVDPLAATLAALVGADISPTKAADARALAGVYRELARVGVDAVATAGQLATAIETARRSAVADRLAPARELFGREFRLPTDPDARLTDADRATAKRSLARFADLLEAVIR